MSQRLGKGRELLFDEIFQVCQLRAYSKHAEVIERAVIKKDGECAQFSEELRYFID